MESMESRRLLSSAIVTDAVSQTVKHLEDRGYDEFTNLNNASKSQTFVAGGSNASGGGAGGGGPEASITVGPVVNISRAAGNQTEADIAINPTNPNQVFAVSNLTSNGLFTSRSNDGGVTWTTLTIAAGGGDGLPTACCDARVEYDSFGNLYMTYIGPSGSNNYVARSTTNGASWTLIDTKTGSWDNPAIDVGYNNQVWVEARGPSGVAGYGAQSTGLGTTTAFTAAQYVPTTASTGNFGDIAVQLDGSILITYTTPSGGQGPATNPVWRDPDGLGPLVWQGAGGGTASPLFNPSTNVGGFDFIPAQDGRSVDSEPSFAVAPPGTPFAGRTYFTYTQEKVAENNDLDIVLRYTDNSGATWTPEIIVNDDNPAIIRSQFLQQIAVDSVTGAIALSWHDARNDNGVLPNGTNAVANDDAQFWGAVSGDGGQTFENFPITLGWSNDDRAANGIDFGDWTGSDFYNGIFHAVWADNSQGANGLPDNPAPNAFDLATARVIVQGVAGSGIFGSVYNDTDADGTRDAGEGGVAGVTVFLDSDNNGSLNGAEPSAVTTASGSYAFGTLPDGTYTVRSITPAGLRPTGPAGGSYSVTLNAGTPIATNRDFGFVNPTISGTVFTDTDDDGIFDAGETGRSGVTVYLDSNNNGLFDGSEPSSVTPAAGTYALAGLADGNYIVRIVPPAGTRQTAPAGAFNVTISPTALSAVNNNFGVTTAVRIAGSVYNDANGNGIRDGGESGIAGARVFIDTNNNGTFDNLNFDFAQNTPLALPDDRTTRFSNLNISGSFATVNNIGVRLNITHTYTGDLDIFLISPAGTRIDLTTDNGQSTDGMNVTLLDSATSSVTTWPTTTGIGPVTGTWRPEGSLASLNGQTLDGLWRLEITDDAGGDSGTLNAWSLFQGFTEPSILTPASGQYAFSPLTAGNYVIRQQALGGGFSFTNPASGAYNLSAVAAEVLARDFGNSTGVISSSTGFYVRLNGAGDTIEIYKANAAVGVPDVSLPVATTPAINLLGSINADTLYVDLVNGNPVPTGGLSFGGTGGSDSAILLGAGGADAATFTGSTIQVGGRTISYTDTESVRFEGNGGNDTLTYQGSTATPTFIGGPGDNTLQVQSGTWTYDVDAATQNETITFVVTGGSLVLNASQHIAAAAISGAGVMQLSAGGNKLFRTGGLTFAGAGKFDLTNGSLIIDYAGASPIAALQAALATGYAAGAWTGNGLNSSTAAASPIADAIGFAEAAEVLTPPLSFAGESVDSSTVVARYTLGGDADLTGDVTLDDFTRLAAGFGLGSTWANGDFDYDGAVSLNDFTTLAANFGQAIAMDLPRARLLPGFAPASNPFATKRIEDDRLVEEVLI